MKAVRCNIHNHVLVGLHVLWKSAVEELVPNGGPELKAEFDIEIWRVSRVSASLHRLAKQTESVKQHCPTSVGH